MAQAGPSTGQPMFTPISHPELRKLGRNPIHNFLLARENYLLRVQDAVSSGSSITPVPLRSSIDRDLLLSLISFETFPGVSKFDDLTEEVLEAWLKEKDEVKLESIPLEDLEETIKNGIKINVHEADAELRIQSLFTDYQTLLRNRKWERLIEDKPQLAVRHICQLLKPPILKIRMEQDIELGVDNLEEDWLLFYKRVVKRAIACEEYVPIKSIGNNSEKMKPTKKGNQGNGTPNSEGGTNPSRPPKAPKCLKDIPDKSIVPREGKALPDCLNPRCNGKHYLRDCTKSSEEEKEKYLKEFRDNRAKQGRLSRLSPDPPVLTESRDNVDTLHPGRLNATLADKVPVILNGDYGADHASLSQYHLEKCAQAGVFVAVLPLPSPIKMGLALQSIGEEGNEVLYTAKRKACVSITINLPQGPLRLRNVQFLVFDAPMPEVLLSRPLLQSIGFNLDKHLSAVRTLYHDADFSHVGFTVDQDAQQNMAQCDKGALSRLLLAPVQQDKESLPIDECEEYVNDGNTASIASALPQNGRSVDHTSNSILSGEGQELNRNEFDDTSLPVGHHDQVTTRNCLDKLIEDAIDNGLPKEYQAEMRSLVFEFADIFRTSLGADPPAAIEPMRIMLKRDAAPVRVKQRRYSPSQASFLRKKVDEMVKLGLVYPNNTSQ